MVSFPPADWLAGGVPGQLLALLSHPREEHRECRSPAHGAVAEDVPFALLHDAIDHGQTEAGSLAHLLVVVKKGLRQQAGRVSALMPTPCPAR